MANLKASIKDIRKTAARRNYNRTMYISMKALVKKLKAIKNKEEAKKMLPSVIAKVDKLGKRKVIHKNKAAHLTSAVTKYVNSL